MNKLIRFNEYSRKEIHDIFSPDTSFTPGAGYWGISGIIKVPNTDKDYIFLVTYGQKQAEHEFDEGIDENGNEKYIEVKTTKGGINNIFHISENEVAFSWQFADKYYLYRVYDLNVKTKSARLKILKGAIHREKLVATEYTCRIGGKQNESI